MKRPLVAAPLVAFALALGDASCKSAAIDAATPEDASDGRPPTPSEWDRTVTRTDEATAAASRASCKFARGALPDETLGSELPTGGGIPIETIVVLMQENRSFDHYFGRFGKYAGRTDVESPNGDAQNPERANTPGSPTHAWQHAAHLCFRDTNHEWDGSHTQYNDGKMDGFFETNDDLSGVTVPDPSADVRFGGRAMTYYDERDLPFYYALAKSFAIGDHYFSSLLGPTWPNRMYLLAATSFGLADNAFPDVRAFPFPDQDAVIFDELEKRHVDWKLYTGGGPPGAFVTGVTVGNRWGHSVTAASTDEFFADAAAGTLPPVVYIDADFSEEGPTSASEHPPGDVQIGQKFTAGIVQALMKSPQWSKLALFITYDEHGGIYDHVPPPKACAPDAMPPVDRAGKPLAGAFDRFGMRVPLVVVSPYAKRNYVSHAVYDHTSILRFIQAKHRLPALTARDANALVPTDLFDFVAPPDLTLPALPEAAIDDAELAYCKATFGKH